MFWDRFEACFRLHQHRSMQASVHVRFIQAAERSEKRAALRLEWGNELETTLATHRTELDEHRAKAPPCLLSFFFARANASRGSN